MTDQPKRLERDIENKMIAGVAAGVAEFFDIDVTIIRIVWAVAVVFGGFGLIIYLIMWIVVPEKGQDRTIAHEIRDATVKDEGEEDQAEE